MYKTLLKVGAGATALAAIFIVWINVGGPLPATVRMVGNLEVKVDGNKAEALETTILVLENEVDNLSLREGKFDGVAKTESIAVQVQRIVRQRLRYQYKLDVAKKKRDKLR